METLSSPAFAGFDAGREALEGETVTLAATAAAVAPAVAVAVSADDGVTTLGARTPAAAERAAALGAAACASEGAAVAGEAAGDDGTCTPAFDVRVAAVPVPELDSPLLLIDSGGLRLPPRVC